MQWQDIVFTVGNLVFIAALLPSVFSKNKPDIKTSALTATVMAIFALTYLSMNLYFSAVVTFVGALTWFLLAWQKHSKK